ncbi:unnamed protein product [Linum trigynum]|uniref:Uncharacterized protein n=1 Tax=Linum trigynum TaxID=586398 RepID=A0AAV2EJT9_9ROSI
MDDHEVRQWPYHPQSPPATMDPPHHHHQQQYYSTTTTTHQQQHTTTNLHIEIDASPAVGIPVGPSELVAERTTTAVIIGEISIST